MTMDTMHLCTAADRRYALPMATLVNSIIDKCDSGPVVVHVLQTNIPKRMMRKLHRMCSGTNVSLDFVDMSGYKFDFDLSATPHWTSAIFYRIMIPEIFSHLDKIIYIDADTLMLGDFRALWDKEIPEEYMVAMVSDKYCTLQQREILNLKQYHNSGMILFKLDKCREFDFGKKCLDWLAANHRIAFYPDQDAINVILQGKIFRLLNEFNWQIVPKQARLLTELPTTHRMIHFLTPVKPWCAGIHPLLGRLYEPYIPFPLSRARIWMLHRINWFGRKIVRYDLESECKEGIVSEYHKIYLFGYVIFKKRLHRENMDVISFLKQRCGYGQK